MSQMQYYYLILRYPLLRKFVTSCFMTNQHDRLYDLLMGLETDEKTATV
jgi:hypothetical protein